MDANDLKTISTEVVDRERLDIVYNELLLPLLKGVAERKGNELQIYENCYRHNILVRLKQLGFNKDLQYLCREEMKPYLVEKGFKVSWSCYFTYIHF